MPSERDRSKRWQFRLRHLFALMTVSAIVTVIIRTLFAAIGWNALALIYIIPFFAPWLALIYIALSAMFGALSEMFERR